MFKPIPLWKRLWWRIFGPKIKYSYGEYTPLSAVFDETQVDNKDTLEP
jgi:hypothetical protein